MRKRFLIALLAVAGACAGVYTLNKSSAARLVAPRTLAERWLAAVSVGDVERAIEFAHRLAPEPPHTVLDPDYALLANRNGVESEFLGQPYTKWDFQLWQHALFFNQLARAIDGSEPGDIQNLFDAVIKHVRPEESQSHHVAWPREIWRRGWGVCDRQAWVLCELAYQSGWQTQVVYLVDAKGVSPHTVAELRRPGGDVWFADPFCKVLLRGMSIDDVAADSRKLHEIWPNRADFRAAIQNSVFWTPAYPQDYCVRNQLLYDRLAAMLGNRCPKFGADPRLRMLRYGELRPEPGSGGREFKMDVWFYPFKLLAHEIAVDRGRALR